MREAPIPIRLRRLSALSLPVCLAAVGGLVLFESRLLFPAPMLAFVLNTIFMVSAFGLVAGLAATGYLSGGGPALLCLGSGALAMAGGILLGTWLTYAPGGLNTGIFVHNVAVLAGALLHLIGLAVGSTGAVGRGRRPAILTLAYLGVLAFLLALAGLGLYGLAPTFFTRETGPTPARQVVLVFAVLGFAVGGGLCWRRYLRGREEFQYWYGLALSLMAIGLAAFLFQRNVGDLLAWASRLIQYLGSLVFIAAAWLASRTAQRSRRPLGEIVSGLIRDPARNLQMLLDAVPDAVFAFDREGRVQLWNPAAERIVGWSAAEAMGNHIAYLLGLEADTDHWWAERAQPPCLREIRLRRRDGGVVPAEASISIRSSAEEEIGLCVLRDITERKQAAEQLRLLNRTLRTISGCNQALVRATDEATLLAEICRVLVETGGYRMAWVGFAEQDEAKTVRPVAHAGHEAGYLETARITWADTERGRGTTGTAIRTGAVGCCQDIRTEDRFRPWRDEAARRGYASVVALPLRDGATSFGALTIYADAPHAFSADEQRLLEELANDLAYGIVARRGREARRRAEEAEREQRGLADSLHQAMRALIGSLDLDEVLDRILAEVARAIPCDAAEISLLRSEVFRTRGEIDPRVVRAHVGAPIRVKERTIGFVGLDSADPDAFSLMHARWLESFAAQAGIAVENARLFRELADELAARERTERTLAGRTELLDGLRVVVTEIARELESEPLLFLIVRRAAELVGAPSGTVSLWDEASQRLIPKAWIGFGDWLADTEGYLGIGLTGVVAQRREGLIVNDYRAWKFANPDMLEHTAITAAVAEPLIYRDRLLGVITLNNMGTARTFTESDREILALFGVHAAVAIENARLYAELNDSFERLQGAMAELVRTEKLRGLGQMAAGIAHDLNNMLATVLGQAEILKVRATDPATRDGLAILETAAIDGAEVVRRLLDFSRQRVDVPATACDLRAIVRESVELTRPRWQDEPQHRGVTIAVVQDLSDDPLSVLGRPAELREIFTNLIFNAVDAMPDGGTLRLAARLVVSSVGQFGEETVLPSQSQIANRTSHMVELTVSDTGIGMTEEVQLRIFDPFFTTKGVRGTGLGLSIVYAVLERSGGRISVTSASGRGTTFALTFPVAPTIQEEPAPAVSREELAPAHILLIEDEASVRRTLGVLLRGRGHTVYEAESGQAGLELLARESVDVVLTDLGMPDMTGWEVARRVAGRRPGLPVILLTGWGEGAKGDQPTDVPVARILSKPVHISDLLKAIREILGPH